MALTTTLASTAHCNGKQPLPAYIARVLEPGRSGLGRRRSTSARQLSRTGVAIVTIHGVRAVWRLTRVTVDPRSLPWQNPERRWVPNFVGVCLAR